MLVMDSEGMLQALDPQQVVCHQNTAPEPVGGARALRSLKVAGLKPIWSDTRFFGAMLQNQTAYEAMFYFLLARLSEMK